MKKRILKCLFSMIAAVILCSSALSVQCFAEFDYNSEDVATDGIFKYILSDDGEEACLIGIDKNFKGVIELPEKLGGHPLVEIAAKTFSYNNINDKINGMNIPACVRKIGSNPYALSKNITAVTIAGESEYFKVSDDILYTTEMDELIGCPQKKSGDLTIPETVQKIESSAFENCKKLKSVKLPDGLMILEEKVFLSCESLTEMKIPGSVKTMGREAFGDCIELKTVTIGEETEKIEEGICAQCAKLENIYVSSNNKNYCDVDGVLLTKDKKKIVEFPDGKTSYVIPEGVTDITGVFSSAERLKELTIASTVKGSIEENLRGCKLLQDIHYPSTTKEIQIERLFDSVLRNIYIDPHNKTFCDIDGVLFSKDKKKLIFFPPERTTDGKIIYTIPDGVEEVGIKSFYGVNREKEVELTVPESVKKISYDAFNNTEMVTIYGKTGSYAEKYASRLMGAKFVDPDAPPESSEEPVESMADTMVSEKEQQSSNNTEKYVLYIVIGLAVILIALIAVIVILINRMKKKASTSETDIGESAQEPEQEFLDEQNGIFNIVNETEQEFTEEPAEEPTQEQIDESIPESELEFTFGSIDDADLTKS